MFHNVDDFYLAGHRDSSRRWVFTLRTAGPEGMEYICDECGPSSSLAAALDSIATLVDDVYDCVAPSVSPPELTLMWVAPEEAGK